MVGKGGVERGRIAVWRHGLHPGVVQGYAVVADEFVGESSERFGVRRIGFEELLPQFHLGQRGGMSVERAPLRDQTGGFIEIALLLGCKAGV